MVSGEVDVSAHGESDSAQITKAVVSQVKVSAVDQPREAPKQLPPLVGITKVLI